MQLDVARSVVRVSRSIELLLPGATVARAARADAAEICVLQRCCWVTEAITNDTLGIPALHETLTDVEEWIESTTVWAVRRRERLIAAVRAHQVDDRWEIGRLMVAPDLRGQGLGRWLLEHAERHAPAGVRHYDLFTGSRSTRNLQMYKAAGYQEQAGPADRAVAGVVYLSKTCAAGIGNG